MISTSKKHSTIQTLDRESISNQIQKNARVATFCQHVKKSKKIDLKSKASTVVLSIFKCLKKVKIIKLSYSTDIDYLQCLRAVLSIDFTIYPKINREVDAMHDMTGWASGILL